MSLVGVNPGMPRNIVDGRQLSADSCQRNAPERFHKLSASGDYCGANLRLTSVKVPVRKSTGRADIGRKRCRAI